MVFNTTVNNISAISWRSVLLMGEDGCTRRKPQTCHKSLTNVNVVSRTLDEITTVVMIGTDCTGSCKSNYHTITTTMAPKKDEVVYQSNIDNNQYLFTNQVDVLVCLVHTDKLSIFILIQTVCLVTHHGVAEILLRLLLNTNQSINQSINQTFIQLHTNN